MQKGDRKHIDFLLRKIEAQLEWGESSGWLSYEFDKLAELIFKRTNVSISGNTLKRVWGRIKYESTPSAVTLNTLSQFLGHTDFRDFVSKAYGKRNLESEKTKNNTWLEWPPFRSRPSTIFGSGAIFMLVTVIALSFSASERKYDPKDFYFTSRKVTKGLPNTVIFEYRAGKAPADAKVEIQQSWDKRRREVVLRDDSLVTSIYFDPGYFDAKLVVDGQTVKQHGLLIPSEGWKAKVREGERTVYFGDSTITVTGKVKVAPKLMEAEGLDFEGIDLHTEFRYVDDFDDLRIDDMYIETKLRNTTDSGANPCRNSSITLLMEGEVIKIPLGDIGCSAEFELIHLDGIISGKNNDLSRLGVDFDNWATVGLSMKNDTLTVNINENKALEISLKGRTNKFHGLIYRFEGMGEIKSLKLGDDKEEYLQWPSPTSRKLKL